MVELKESTLLRMHSSVKHKYTAVSHSVNNVWRPYYDKNVAIDVVATILYTYYMCKHSLLFVGKKIALRNV